MQEKEPVKKKKKGFIRRWFDFFMILVNFVVDLIRTLLIRYLAFFKKKPFTAIFVPVAVAFVALIVVGVAAYAMFNYTMYDPKFCRVCHTLMNESYVTWEASKHGEEHGNVTCHTCHPLTPDYIVSVAGSLIRGVIKGFPEEIPERPDGEVVVENKNCMMCHWDKPHEGLFAHHVPEEAPKVASSRFHATHYYLEQLDCALCHGYARKRLHVFTSEPDDCLDCHEKHEDKVHAGKASDVACLNCHTDSTANLEPTNEKCFFCHGKDESAKKTLAQAGTLDVRYFQPTEETISAASKIDMLEDAPMQQFACQDCHKAHEEEDADARKYDACLSCHPRIESVGQHEVHMMLGDCTQCHQPHSWNVTDESICLDCHSDKEEKLHGSETEKATCISCHTENLEHSKSDRKLCLSCHGEDESVKAEGAIEAASKIAIPENAPMQQFTCQDCHKSHEEEDADARKYDACLACHSEIEGVGEHEMHMMLADCTQCHQPHSWNVTDENICLDCHSDKEEKQHGSETENVTCISCHTENLEHVKSDRKLCLSCHSEDESMKAEGATQAASKIAIPENAPMQQFACQDCHKAHEEEDATVRKYDACLACHPQIESVGQHEMHMMLADEADCTQCHQPHSWSVSEDDVETACGICHGEDVTDPMTFISSGGET